MSQLYIYGNNKQLVHFDGGLDRANTCTPFNIFEYKSDTPYQLFFNQKITGAGSSYIRNTTESLIRLTAGSGGGRVISTSHRYIYDSCCSMQEYILGFTFSEGSPIASCEYRVGCYDNPSDMVGTPNIQANGGHYLRYDTVNGLAVVQRQITSTTPYFVDTVVLQANFNRDKLDGTGPSALTFDPQKAYLLSIRRNNWGVGYVEFSLYITSEYGSERVPFHRIENLSITKPFIKSGKNPITYELINNGVSPAIMYQLDSSCSNLGTGIPASKITPVLSNEITLSTTPQVLMGFRLKSTRIRSTFFISGLNMYGTGWDENKLVSIKMIVNPTITGSPVWSDPDSLGSVEMTQTLGLTYTGGRVVREFLFSGKQLITGYSTSDIDMIDLPLITADLSGNPYTVYLVMTELFSGVGDMRLLVNISEFI